MSEETYEDKVLKALATLAKQNAELSEILKNPKPTESSKQQHKKHSAEIDFDCPDCQKAYDAEVAAKARPQILQEIREKQKNMKRPNLCEDCGEVYDRETEKDCPTCHPK